MSKTIPLRPENEQFTDGQWQAIFDGEENILVSASAGSGKTTVLVRRVIEKIQSGVPIDRLLIVTYTEAAAKEMKERIQKALKKAISNEMDIEKKQFFVQQLVLLPTASISTLHAFCLTVIRRFYYLIDMDPVFRLLTDETEMLLLKEDVWDTLREELYASNQVAFYQLTSNFSNDRTDDGLTKLVFSLYEFAKANPDPMYWLEQLVNGYQVHESLGESMLYQRYLKPALIESLGRCIVRYDEMIQLTQGEEKLVKIVDLAQQEKIQVELLLNLLVQNNLEDSYKQIQTFSFARYPSVRVEELKEVAQQAKELREKNKKVLLDLTTKLFTISPEKMQQVLGQAVAVVQEISKVGQKFLQAYGEEKLKKGLVDFNDLEHFTLEILAPKKDGQCQGSEASMYYREKFDEVLVDEYQDINRLQETILSWLSHAKSETGNLFMVGDVKQSIYSFRLADPTLFIEKYQQYRTGENGKRIILAENFRSRKNVLDFTNLVFSQLMDVHVGQMDYDESAQLINGFTAFPTAENYDTELLIYEKETVEQQESMLFDAENSPAIIGDKTEGELHMVALKIRELVDSQFLIYDKHLKINRPIMYQDIVLLTPTKKNNLAILDIFKIFHLPVQVNDTQNYFQATEIQTMVCLLQIIDNPYQDIAFTAVLRSPIVGLKENDLARIRLADRKNSYYHAFVLFNQQHHVNNDERKLQKKTIAFARLLNHWRDISHQVKIATLISKIYQDTAYLEYVLGMPAAKQRQANLYALIERAERYEQTSFRGLFQFIRFIEKMREKEKDLAEPVIFSEKNTIRVMTIHASKGLEFPVVFILDMSKEFNLSDVNERYIFDEQLGIGIRYMDQEERMLYDTFPYLVLKQEKIKKLLSEEMRKLYVALTRAEQKLYLVGSYKNQSTMWKEWLQVANVETQVLPVENRLQGKNSLMNWIGSCLARHQQIEKYQHEVVTEHVFGVTQHPAAFSIHFYHQSMIEQQMKQIPAKIEQVVESNELTVDQQQIQKGIYRLNYVYPYEVATKTTNYQSVSEIKRVFEDPNNKEIAKIEWKKATSNANNPKIVHRMTEGELGKPTFMIGIAQVSSAEIGTATHRIMQLLDLHRTPTLDSIHQLTKELVKNGIIKKNVAQKLNPQQMLNVYQTKFGQTLLKNADHVVREQPFSMLLHATELIRDYPIDVTDDLLIHGMIDGYIIYDDSCTLYDYKTDYIKDVTDKNELLSVIKRYKGQLNLYKKALEQATHKPVMTIYLILLSAGIIIDMEQEKIVEKII